MASTTPVNYLRFAQDDTRYTHAKAILFTNRRKTVLCIGSANFTTAALLHGTGPLSNIEAMLRYEIAGVDPWTGLFAPLDASALTNDADPDEGAPALPEFDADVVYDWLRQEFRWL